MVSVCLPSDALSQCLSSYLGFSYLGREISLPWRDWCWSWNSNTLVTWCGEITHLKDPDAGKDWGQEEKGTTVDEMVGWHHWHNEHGFGWTLGGGDGQGGLCAAVHGVAKSWTWLSDWTELTWTGNLLKAHQRFCYYCAEIREINIYRFFKSDDDDPHKNMCILKQRGSFHCQEWFSSRRLSLGYHIWMAKFYGLLLLFVLKEQASLPFK